MPAHTLIRGVNWVGDAVMTLPALRAVRRSMPDGAGVSLLVRPWVSQLFEHDPNVDEIILYEDGHRSIRGRFGLAKALRAKGFSRAILLPNSLDAALIAYLARIPERIGYRRDGRGLLLTKAVAYKGEDRRMHHIDYYLKLLRGAGIPAEASEPWLYLTLEERLRAREELTALKRPLVGINPGAAFGSAKQWLPERFAQAAHGVIEELNGSVLIFGGRAETGIGEEISRRYGGGDGGRLRSYAGKTTLRELMALISECDILLTNDSGPMHIGYALKTPLVAIFGSTEPALTGPPGRGNIVIRRPMACSPCFKRTCPEKYLKCMEAITAEEVSGAVRQLLPTCRAVFFDRDGTLSADAHYLNRWEDFRVFEGIGSLKSLAERGFKLIGITNQSGVGRGIVDEGFVREVNAYFIENHGFEDFYYCPHHPSEHCPCRKPEPGMLLRARMEHGIDLRRSYVVGDKDSDMLAAKAAGARGVFVLTGQEAESPLADFTARSLEEAVELILADV